MSMTVLFLLTCVTGAYIQTVCGFGFGIFVLSMFPYFLPSINEGVVISNILSMSQSFFVAYKLRKKADISLILPALLSYFVVSGALIYLFSYRPDEIYKRMLGVALVLMSAYFFFFNNRIKIRRNIKNSVIAGGLSGALGGLFGMSGPPIAAYLFSVCEDDTEKYSANIQLFLGVCNLYSISARVLAGIVNAFALTYSLIGAIALVTGIYAGRKTYKVISANQLRLFVYSVMAASGVILFFS